MIRTPAEAATLGRSSGMVERERSSGTAEREVVARDADAPIVWYPEQPAGQPPAGARLEIDNGRVHRLVVHHLGQHGRLDHGPHSAAIRLFSSGDVPAPNTVYIAPTTHAVAELVTVTARLRPIGLVAPADLGHLPAVTTAVLSGVSSRGPAADAIGMASATLTPRSLDVLDLVAQGMTNSEIAEHLNFSLSTVKRDVTELFDWFGVSSRRELARAARRLGLIPSPYGGLDTTDWLEDDDFLSPWPAASGQLA